MSGFKELVIILLLETLVLCSCMEQKIAFRFNADVNKDFFKEIPGIGNDKYLDSQITKMATSIDIYRSSFKEKYVEKNNLLEFTELNDSSVIPDVNYLNVRGYSQDLYLLQYNFTYRITDNNQTFNIPVNACIYFSVKHNGKGETIGITPAYLGIVNTKKHLIEFETDLLLKRDKNKFYLSPFAKKKNKRDLLFMPVDFSQSPVTSNFVINIEKIVRLDANKVGGTKPLIFNIHDIFNDANALQFHYFKTIQLSP